ncbi:MAG: hypothetical protein QOE83_1008, partial [Actinomycetota bacterium]|nr:hypothetical protein [Actinomycetota bacterium]
MRIGVRRRLLGRLVAGMVLVVLVLPFPAQATVVTIYVDQNDVNCADSGPDIGTQAKPFCSIDPAAQVAVGGQRVQVAEGTYFETVRPSHSGARGSRIVFRAAPHATVTVTGGSHGFDIDTKGWISVVGFTITGTSDTGIDVHDSTHITVRRNDVSFSGEPVSGSNAAGIVLQATNNSLVLRNTSDHNTDGGIYLNTGSTRNLIKGNILFSNARQYTRAAPGVDVRSPGNTIVGNISHDNEDSGIQLYTGANDSIVYDNLTYNNGDHGIDCLNSTGAVIVGNSVYKSTTAGINLEGASGTSASTGGTVENNISVDNGLTNTSGTHGNI